MMVYDIISNTRQACHQACLGGEGMGMGMGITLSNDNLFSPLLSLSIDLFHIVKDRKHTMLPQQL